MNASMCSISNVIMLERASETLVRINVFVSIAVPAARFMNCLTSGCHGAESPPCIHYFLRMHYLTIYDYFSNYFF